MGKIMFNGESYTGGTGDGHAYSTTEQVVGTWIDGSPLYEITLETNTQVNLDNQNWTTIPWNNEPSNIDFLVSIEITRVCPNTNYGLRFTNVDGHIKGASLIPAPFPPVQNLTEYVVIRYTKSST